MIIGAKFEATRAISFEMMYDDPKHTIINSIELLDRYAERALNPLPPDDVIRERINERLRSMSWENLPPLFGRKPLPIPMWTFVRAVDSGIRITRIYGGHPCK